MSGPYRTDSFNAQHQVFTARDVEADGDAHDPTVTFTIPEEAIADRQFEIEFLESGVEVYAFTG